MQRTLAILKPDCVRKNLIGKVIKRLEAEGFKIVAESEESIKVIIEPHGD